MMMVTSQACVPIGDDCADNPRYWSEGCCGGPNAAACLEPYLYFGSAECMTCSPYGAPCERRTDCCSNCCGASGCTDASERCNDDEKLESLLLKIGLVVVGIGLCCCVPVLVFLCATGRLCPKKKDQDKDKGAGDDGEKQQPTGV